MKARIVAKDPAVRLKACERLWWYTGRMAMTIDDGVYIFEYEDDNGNTLWFDIDGNPTSKPVEVVDD